MVHRQFVLAVILLVVFALTRWPGLFPVNFSAVYALIFCGGLFIRGKAGWFLPLGVLFVTDLCLNYYYAAKYGINAFHIGWLGNYVAYPIILWLSRRFSLKSSFFTLLSGGLAGAVLFYLISNTAAWWQMVEYPKNLAGWLQALTRGTLGWPSTLEFFRNTFMSTGLFMALFATAMKVTEPKEEEVEEETETEPVRVPPQPVEEAEAQG